MANSQAESLVMLINTVPRAVCLHNWVITLQKEDDRYVMRNSHTGAKHSLLISETTPDRLHAHWTGFVENNNLKG